MNNKRLQLLFLRYIEGTASEAERKELMQLLADPALEQETKELIDQYWTNWPAHLPSVPHDADHLFGEISRSVHAYENAQRPKLLRLRSRQWMAAASVIILLGIAGWWWRNNSTGEKNDTITSIDSRNKPAEIPAPASSKAMLTLADGTTIVLDSAADGVLAQQGQLRVVKTADGQIRYEGGGEEMLYHTLTNPRGSRVVGLTLTDGSKVWLNSESSLRYPAVFSGNTREVEITGEAYFEVAHDSRKPFLVRVNDVTTAVLGTSFNINAYAETSTIRVTLLDGAVRVMRNNQALQLAPGQQAAAGADGITLHRQVDIEQVMAWKNGYFSFKQADLQSVMAQVARWYDLQVVIEEGVAHITFSGDIDRDLTLNQVLSILAETRINYRIEGNKLVILP